MVEVAVTAADLDAFAECIAWLTGDSTASSTLSEGLAELLRPDGEQLPPLPTESLTLGVDGLLDDDLIVYRATPPSTRMARLFGGSAGPDPFASTDALLLFALALWHVRLRTSARLARGIRELTHRVFEGTLPPALTPYLTIALRPDCDLDAVDLSVLHEAAGGLRPAAQHPDVTDVTPGVFTLPLYTPEECEAILGDVRQPDGWHGAVIQEYTDLLQTERDQRELRRRAGGTVGHA